jgi:hypothetical protein
VSDLKVLLTRLTRFAHDTVMNLLVLPLHLAGVVVLVLDCLAFAACTGLLAAGAVMLLLGSPLAAVVAGILWAAAIFTVSLLRTVFARYGAGEE